MRLHTRGEGCRAPRTYTHTQACIHANGGVAPLPCVLHHALSLPISYPQLSIVYSFGELFASRAWRLGFVCVCVW